MNAQVTKGENFTCTMEITVESSEVKKTYNKLIKDAVRFVTVPGFRKGKAPAKLAEKQLNMDMVRNQLVEELIPGNLRKASEENDVRMISTPDIEIVQFDPDRDFIFKAVCEIKPDIEIENYKGLKIEQDRPEVTDEDVDKALAVMQESSASFEPVEEERPLELGDYALVDFECYLDGEKLDEGSASNYVLEAKEEGFIPGFVAEILGMGKDEEKEFEITFPEDYGYADLQGKTAQFKVKMHGLRKKVVPGLNDDFAREISNFDTLAELKTDLRERFVANVNEKTKIALEGKINDKLAEMVEGDIPVSLVNHEQQKMLDEMKRTFTSQGLDFYQYMKERQGELSTIMESRRPEAVKRAKAELALEYVAENENIKVSEKEVDDRIREISSEIGEDFYKIKANLQRDHKLATLSYYMRQAKAMEFLIENADVTYVLPKEPETRSESSEYAEASEEDSEV